MSLNTWLMPDENIVYSSPKSVEYSGLELRFHITNMRIVMYNKQGLIFKKETIIAEYIDDIVSMAYDEEGILFAKKGILKIHTKHKKMKIKGKTESIKVIWQNLQQYMKRG